MSGGAKEWVGVHSNIHHNLERIINESLVQQSSQDSQPDKDTKKLAKAQRKNREDETRHVLKIWFLRFSALLTAVVIVIYLFHLCAPEGWRWLPEADLQKIKDLAITIIVGLILSLSTSNLIKPKKNKKRRTRR